MINLTSNDLDLVVPTYQPIADALFIQGHLWSVYRIWNYYLMKSTLSKSSGVKGSFFLYSFIAVQQHFNMGIWHSRSTSRNSKSTFYGLKTTIYMHKRQKLIHRNFRYLESFDSSKFLTRRNFRLLDWKFDVIMRLEARKKFFEKYNQFDFNVYKLRVWKDIKNIKKGLNGLEFIFRVKGII